MKEIRYETPTSEVDWTQPTIFLAGPTVRGNQPHLTSWRFEAVELFKKKGFDGNLIIPEFVSKTESDKYRYDLPAWEYYGLSKSGVIMFWIPRTRELIGLTTNCEFGYWMARDRYKMVYGRPDDAYRMKYLDLMWEMTGKQSNGHHDIYLDFMWEMTSKQFNGRHDIYNTLGNTVDAAMKKLSFYINNHPTTELTDTGGRECPN